MGDMGIKDKNKNNYFIAQFADDTSFSVINNKSSIHTLFKLLSDYGDISGLKLNIDKTEILLLGTGKINDIPQRYRKHQKNVVNYLGCKITDNYQETTKINIEEATNKFKSLLNTWKHRKTNLKLPF
jgi:hypothetical protein